MTPDSPPFRPDALPLPQPLLRPARMHEAVGAGAVAFAAMVAAGLCGGGANDRARPVLWLRLSHEPGLILPAGLAPILPPARLMLACAGSEVDLLWAVEESLRAGAVALVVAQTGHPLSLTAGRRLQLAAEAGHTPALMLIREGAGSNAAETRWACTPVFDSAAAGAGAAAADSTLHHWRIIKNKSGTLGEWVVRWDEEARAVGVVSPPAHRAGLAAQAL